MPKTSNNREWLIDLIRSHESTNNKAMPVVLWPNPLSANCPAFVAANAPVTPARPNAPIAVILLCSRVGKFQCNKKDMKSKRIYEENSVLLFSETI